MSTLATLLVLLVPATADAACDDETNVRVATINAWGLPAPIARERRTRLPRIQRWLSESGVDVAGLQEVWRGALKWMKGPLHLGRTQGDTGLALHSRHPVEAVEAHTFEHERGFDAFKAKGVLAARVRVDDAPMTVAVTHLQSGGGSRNADVRALQVGEILDSVGQTDTPLVLMGDFNFYADEPGDVATHERLVEAGFVDAAGEMGATGGTYPGLRHRFDRVYVRSRCAVARAAEVVDGHEMSDHDPVMVELSL